MAHAAAAQSLSIDFVLVWIAILLIAAVVASRLSDRLGVPSLLLFLAIGMLAGSEGIGGIPFDDARLTQSIGVVALAFILFAGGLETEWAPVRTVLWRGLSLATFGVVITTALCGVFAAWLLAIPWTEGLLLGAIISSTDAAAVFSVMRSQGIQLKGRIGPLLELESGSNDPMAVLLTLALIKLITVPGTPLLEFVWMFVLEIALGLAFGYALGRATVWSLNRIRIQAEGLYPVLLIAAASMTYGLTATLGGSGFLAVYVAGIVIGNANFVHKRSLIRFTNGLAWLMQIAMFLTLGLLVYPSRLWKVVGLAAAVSFFLIVVARPVSVFASLALASMPVRSKAMVAWVGLRGAVPIVLATFPLLAGLKHSELFFNVVFFTVLVSVLIQGTTLGRVAKWLGLEAEATSRPVSPLEFAPGRKTNSDIEEMVIGEGSVICGKRIVDLPFPKSALVVLLSRGDEYLVPRGGTVLRAGDGVLVLADKADLPELRSLLDPAAAGESEEA